MNNDNDNDNERKVIDTQSAASMLVTGAAVLFGGNPGAIEAQEAQGQRSLVNSTQLPADGTVGQEGIFASIGIVLGPVDKDDPMFRPAQLPEGWSKKATDHSMHSELLDANGCTRAGIFYKAAFYDRSARITLRRRLTCGRDYSDEWFKKEEVERYFVHDHGTLKDGKPAEIWTKVHIGIPEPYSAAWRAWHEQHNPRAEPLAWLLERFHDHEDPTAYWGRPIGCANP